MFSTDRNHLRKTLINAWQNALSEKMLTPLEKQIVTIVRNHPEYHSLLTNDKLDQDYLPEHGQTNPFLHIAMHLSIEEQINLDRPYGIKQVYTTLLHQWHDAHSVEHKMIACLGECLWEAQRNHTLPNEEKYLAQLQKCIGIIHSK